MITWVKPAFPFVLEYQILTWSFWKLCQVVIGRISCLGKIKGILPSPLPRCLMTIATSRQKFWTASGELDKVASEHQNNSCLSLWPVLKAAATGGHRWITNFSICKNKCCPPQEKSFLASHCPSSKKLASCGCELAMKVWLWTSNIIWRFLINLSCFIPTLDTKTDNPREFKPFFTFCVEQTVLCHAFNGLFVEIRLSSGFLVREWEMTEKIIFRLKRT